MQGRMKSEDVIAATERALALSCRTKAAIEAALGPEIAKECPHLAAMLADPDMSNGRLRAMMELVGRVNRGEVPEDTASVAVGGALVDEYIKPLIQKQE